MSSLFYDMAWAYKVILCTHRNEKTRFWGENEQWIPEQEKTEIHVQQKNNEKKIATQINGWMNIKEYSNLFALFLQ